MDGRGGSPARGDRVDDRLGPGHDVATGEDAGPPGGQRPGIGHDAGPAADLDPGALRAGSTGRAPRRRRPGWSWPGAPGRSRERAPRWRGRRRSARAACREIGRRRLGAADADHGAVAAQHLDRGETRPDDDPLALGGLDLLDLGRHLGPAAAVDDGDRRGTAAPGRPRGVHRRAAAADDHGRTAQPRLLAEVDPLEEERGRDHARRRRRRGRRAAGSSRRPVARKTAR